MDVRADPCFLLCVSPSLGLLSPVVLSPGAGGQQCMLRAVLAGRVCGRGTGSHTWCQSWPASSRERTLWRCSAVRTAVGRQQQRSADALSSPGWSHWPFYGMLAGSWREPQLPVSTVPQSCRLPMVVPLLCCRCPSSRCCRRCCLLCSRGAPQSATAGRAAGRRWGAGHGCWRDPWGAPSECRHAASACRRLAGAGSHAWPSLEARPGCNGAAASARALHRALRTTFHPRRLPPHRFLSVHLGLTLTECRWSLGRAGPACPTCQQRRWRTTCSAAAAAPHPQRAACVSHGRAAFRSWRGRGRRQRALSLGG